MILDPEIHRWLMLTVTAAMLISLAWEKVSLEVTSLAVVVFLLIWFTLFPMPTGAAGERIDPEALLAGFANPALLAVMALLVMGQALVQTGTLADLSGLVGRIAKNRKRAAIGASLATVAGTSAFLNNTPVVVIFIPIMQSLAVRLHVSPSRLMMPLSFAAILGGMTTLMGSSTNLLVNSALIGIGRPGLGFFEMTAAGVCLALIGGTYVLLVLPRLLPHRGGLSRQLSESGKQFVAEIEVEADSPLVGNRAVAGQFKDLPGMTIQLIQRGRRTLYPPFDELTLQPGDVVVVAATKADIAEALSHFKGRRADVLTDPVPHGDKGGNQPVLAEVMIAPASRMIDQSVTAVAFEARFGCVVLGVQRRGRMRRQRLGEIRLEAGDVLLLLGGQNNVRSLSANPDMLLMTWAIREVPRRERAPAAAAVFVGTIAVAATGLLPISVAAITGAGLMLAFGCLNVRQATRALDRTIWLLVGASLALGTALDSTGAAAMAARGLISIVPDGNPLIALTVLFALTALATNILTNNATAVLFTPIAIGLADGLGVSASLAAITVILAANCSFATPIGYQTNLLVMGPGHYRFSDFLRGGLPLVVIMTVSFAGIMGWLYF